MIKFFFDAMYYQFFIYNRDKFKLEDPHERTILLFCGILFLPIIALIYPLIKENFSSWIYNYVVITNGLAGNTISVITLCYKLNLLCMIGFYLPTISVLPLHEPFVSHPLSDSHCDRHYKDYPNHSYDISVIQPILLHH